MRRIEIFDTTLRDGEQGVRNTLSPIEKYAIAQTLAQMGVDVIEAGFPSSSPGSFKAVRMIAENIRGPSIAGLAKVYPLDEISTLWDAVKYAEKPRVHIVASTSPIHMQVKLQKTPDEVYDMSMTAIRFAKNLMNGRGTLEFSCEDATRSEKEYLSRIIAGAIGEGADVINIPDTVGYAVPSQFKRLLLYLQKQVPKLKGRLSVHCHNDLGRAVDNTMTGIEAGASQVEVTVNGIGERAGNASLEEVVTNLKVRNDFYRFETGIDARFCYRISRMVSGLMDIPVQPNKAIVGDNAFKHRSGIHQDGVIKGAITYEIMKPEDYGWPPDRILDRIEITSMSGRRAIKAIVGDLGYRLTKEELDRLYALTMDLTDKRKTVTPEDLIALLDDEVRKPPEIASLVSYHVTTGSHKTPTAVLELLMQNHTLECSSTGDGPIDASYRAINSALGLEVVLSSFNISVVGVGKDAQGETKLTITTNGNKYSGRGVSTDIIESSIKAYINALNHMLNAKENQTSTKFK